VGGIRGCPNWHELQQAGKQAADIVLIRALVRQSATAGQVASSTEGWDALGAAHISTAEGR
jgi:hypothetical protein